MPNPTFLVLRVVKNGLPNLGVHIENLKKYNIPVVVHMMVGLPEERYENIIDTVKLINDCGCEGIKIHSTYIIRDTVLEQMYKEGTYKPITQEYYVNAVLDIISHLKMLSIFTINLKGYILFKTEMAAWAD